MVYCFSLQRISQFLNPQFLQQPTVCWIVKEQFQIEKEAVIGMVKTEERINFDAIAYNLIRLYNLKQEIQNTTEDLEDFCESTSIKNQLKLDVTIF